MSKHIDSPDRPWTQINRKSFDCKECGRSEHVDIDVYTDRTNRIAVFVGQGWTIYIDGWRCPDCRLAPPVIHTYEVDDDCA